MFAFHFKSVTVAPANKLLKSLKLSILDNNNKDRRDDLQIYHNNNNNNNNNIIDDKEYLHEEQFEIYPNLKNYNTNIRTLQSTITTINDEVNERIVIAMITSGNKYCNCYCCY